MVVECACAHTHARAAATAADFFEEDFFLKGKRKPTSLKAKSAQKNFRERGTHEDQQLTPLMRS